MDFKDELVIGENFDFVQFLEIGDRVCKGLIWYDQF